MEKISTSYTKRLLIEASNLYQKGKWIQAKKLYLELIKLIPNDAELLKNLGMIEMQCGNLQESVFFLKKSILISPNQSNILFYIGNIYLALGRHEEAILKYDLAIKLNPNFAEAYNNRGNAQQEIDSFEDALTSYSQAISIDCHYVDAFNNQGNVLVELSRFDEALVSYSNAISLNISDPELFFNRAICFDKLKKFDEALVDYDKAIAIDSGYTEAYFNRGVVHNQLKDFDNAILDYGHAIKLKPDYAKAYINRGNVLLQLKRFNDALVDYDEVIALGFEDEETYLNRGRAFYELKWIDDALISFDKAIELKVDNCAAYLAKGLALQDQKRHDDALFYLESASKIEPDNILIIEQILASKSHCCDWVDYEILLNKIVENSQNARGIFHLFALIDNPKIHQKVSKLLAQQFCSEVKILSNIPKHPINKKLRIGYFSADFHEHPVSFLLAELFELHNRESFEIVAFSFSRYKDSPMRKRLEKGFDQFIDVKNKTDQEVVTLVRDMKIDIAIDLGGYTGDSRTKIYAMRAAPIQVNYLGFSGTMGAEFIDYIIGDSNLIPIEAQSYFSEMVAYLPGSFMVNDSTLKPSEEAFSRKDFNLPEKGFVFSCFNASYKITPASFLGWMRILKAVDDSVLWLSHMNETAMKNLKDKADECGIDPNRIIFASRMPSLNDHLNRIRLADLFLDTFPYNAHTTSNDALRVGLPVLTLMGKSFASRVAASLLNAVDMPELITNSQEEYEALAIELASNTGKLKNLKNKLLNNLPDSYLTDTKRFTKNLESAYQLMYQRYQDDLPPDHIYVDA